MPRRNWFFAGFGLVLAVAGGLSEARGILILGGLAAVTGLVSWVFFSGSSFLFEHADVRPEPPDDTVGGGSRMNLSDPSGPDAADFPPV